MASRASGVKIASSFGPELRQIDGNDLGLELRDYCKILTNANTVSILFAQFLHQEMILRVAAVVKVPQLGHAD